MEYYLKRKQNKKDMSCNECEDSSRSLKEQPCGDDSEKQRSITPEEDVVSVNNVCRNEKEFSESCSSSSSCCSTSGESDSEDSGIGDLTGKNIVSISSDYCVMSPPTEWSSDEEEEYPQDSDDESDTSSVCKTRDASPEGLHKNGSCSDVEEGDDDSRDGTSSREDDDHSHHSFVTDTSCNRDGDGSVDSMSHTIKVPYAFGDECSTEDDNGSESDGCDGDCDEDDDDEDENDGEDESECSSVEECDRSEIECKSEVAETSDDGGQPLTDFVEGSLGSTLSNTIEEDSMRAEMESAFEPASTEQCDISVEDLEHIINQSQDDGLKIEHELNFSDTEDATDRTTHSEVYTISGSNKRSLPNQFSTPVMTNGNPVSPKRTRYGYDSSLAYCYDLPSPISCSASENNSIRANANSSKEYTESFPADVTAVSELDSPFHHSIEPQSFSFNPKYE